MKNITVEVELTDEQAQALLAWQDTPYRGCNDYLPVVLSGIGYSLLHLALIEPSAYPGVNGYKLSELGKQVKAKLLEGA